MRKLLTGIVTMGLLLSVGITTTFAAGTARGRNFADTNNDGICDYYNTSCQFVDNDGDGICDNCGFAGCGMGIGYIDADGDGICDNYYSDRCSMGAGYVDADGDGICDNYAARTTQNGSGIQRGRCGGQGGKGRYCNR